MTQIVKTPGRAQGRIPQGYSLSVTFADSDSEDGRFVYTSVVYAEIHKDGEFIGSKIYNPDGLETNWPAWAESVMRTRLLLAAQL